LLKSGLNLFVYAVGLNSAVLAAPFKGDIPVRSVRDRHNKAMTLVTADICGTG